jgi:hypothetical protein
MCHAMQSDEINLDICGLGNPKFHQPTLLHDDAQGRLGWWREERGEKERERERERERKRKKEKKKERERERERERRFHFKSGTG